jgi:hypothetical protein
MTSLTSRQEKDPLGILSLPASRFRSGTQRIVARTLGRPMGPLRTAVWSVPGNKFFRRAESRTRTF